MQLRSKPPITSPWRDSRSPKASADEPAAGNDSRFESAWDLRQGLVVDELDELPADFRPADDDARP